MSDAPNPKTVPFALVVSGALNLVLIGALAGFALRPPPPPPDGPPLHRPQVERAVSSEDMDTVRGLMRAAFRDSDEQRIELKKAQMAVAKLLQQDTYDEAAVRAALDDLGAADSALKTAIRDSLLERVAALPPDQRQRIASVLIPRLSMGPRGMGPGKRMRHRGAPE